MILCGHFYCDKIKNFDILWMWTMHAKCKHKINSLDIIFQIVENTSFKYMSYFSGYGLYEHLRMLSIRIMMNEGSHVSYIYIYIAVLRVTFGLRVHLVRKSIFPLW